MQQIELTQGKIALVDDEDYAALSQFNWRAYLDKRTGIWYAVRNLPRMGKRQPTQRMHSFILPGVPIVDHEDRDGLNNQRHNLRPATSKQNMANSVKSIRKFKQTSQYKGVSRRKGYNRWIAQIILDKVLVYRASFTSELEAAQAYDAEAIKHFGEFARLNFPKEVPQCAAQ